MKRKDVLAILVPSFIFVIAWILLSILHNIATSTISEAVNTQITPISATFDTSAITELKKRQNISPSYETSIPVENITVPSVATASAITPPPAPSPTPVIDYAASGSANLATPEGSLLQ